MKSAVCPYGLRMPPHVCLVAVLVRNGAHPLRLQLCCVWPADVLALKRVEHTGGSGVYAQPCAAHQPPQAPATAHAWAARDAPPRVRTSDDTRLPEGGCSGGGACRQASSYSVLQPAAASPAAQLHSFAPPPLLPNSTRKKILSAPSFFATALGKILPFFVV